MILLRKSIEENNFLGLGLKMSMYLLDVGVLFLTVDSYCIIFSQELKKQWYPDTVLKTV